MEKKYISVRSVSFCSSLRKLHEFFQFGGHYRTIMTRRSLVSSCVQCCRHFSSSSSPNILKPGDVLRQSRKFSNQDVVEYAKVSHDSNPLHFDSDSARKAGFQDRVVHGMLVVALFPRIISSHFPGAVYVSQSLHFKLPVYIGDEVVAEVEAINIKENKNRFIAKFSTKCFKNGELLVLDGEAMAMLPTLDAEQVHSTG